MPAEDTLQFDAYPHADQLLIAAIERIRPLLGSASNREHLSEEVTLVMTELGFDRCSVWRVGSEHARLIYRYERPGTTLEPTAETLSRERDAWLFASAERDTPTRAEHGSRIRCAIPASASARSDSSHLLEVECAASDGARIKLHTDSSLQFMSDILCAVFCYLSK
jgi:hypothetical protein